MTGQLDQGAATQHGDTRFRGFLRARFASPSAVYGLILFTVLIAVASDDHSHIGEVAIVSVSSLLVFFVAHVFAHTLADHGELGLRRATAQAVHHSSGMLYASLPPGIVLGIGAVAGANAETISDIALVVSVLVLGVLGYFAYARRTDSVAIRLVGALGTAFLGGIVMLLDYFVH